MKFTNDARPRDTKDDIGSGGRYGYDRPSMYLLVMSTFFQKLISQAATFMLTEKFHTQECGIFVSEGGCNIVGVGELTLMDRYCMLGSGRDKHQLNVQRCADLITKIVLGWDPMAPITTLTEIAAAFIDAPPDALNEAIGKSYGGGAFSGDALWCFFNLVKEQNDKKALRPYRRYVMTNFGGKTDADVNQIWKDSDLGEDLKDRLAIHLRKRGGFVFACSPSRGEDGLRFWINVSDNKQGTGWVNQESIEDFLASNKSVREWLGE